MTRAVGGVSRSTGTKLVAAAFLVTMLGTTMPTPLYPIYQQELGFGGLMVTVVFATYAVGVLAALLLVGRLSDQVGRKAVLLPGLGVAAASSRAPRPPRAAARSRRASSSSSTWPSQSP